MQTKPVAAAAQLKTFRQWPLDHSPQMIVALEKCKLEALFGNEPIYNDTQKNKKFKKMRKF